MMRRTWILCGFALFMAGCASEPKPADSATTATSAAETKPDAQPAAKPDKSTAKIKTEDLKVGSGRVAEEGDIALVSYRGTLTDGTEFDTNIGGEKPPLAFMIGSGSVIDGYDQGVRGMKVGGQRKIMIPSVLGYGERGSEPAVPPNADLVFTVTLHELVKKGQENDYTKKILKQGTGAPAKDGDTLSVHYTGTFVNGVKFDSSRDRGQPFDFTLGQGQVIKGWDPGLVGIKKGERRIMTIAPGIAYGAEGRGPSMPGNMVLIFDIECVDIKRGN